MEVISVAIDGPAGVGKSTVSKLLAKKLNWNVLDTGALYRAFVFECLKRNIDVKNEEKVIEAVPNISISVKYENEVQRTFVNDVDVTDLIRTEEIDKNVSYISKIKEVRDSIKDLQRNIATNENVVVEGRDIGTVVIKETVNKFFLVATPYERAKRRYLERLKKGEHPNFDEILDTINLRDKIDSERETSPLVQAEDAILVDTTNMSIDEVVDFIYSHIKK